MPDALHLFLLKNHHQQQNLQLGSAVQIVLGSSAVSHPLLQLQLDPRYSDPPCFRETLVWLYSGRSGAGRLPQA